MRNRKGNIELLLLLCCLVGVVTFFSISLAFTSILLEPENKPELLKKWQDLLKEKEQKEAKAQSLEEERKNLERQRREKEKALSHGDNISETQRRKMVVELNKLNEEYDLLRQKIEKLRKELATLAPLPDPQKRQEKKRELEALQKKLAELERKIKEKNEILARMGKEIREDSFKENREALNRELEEIRQKRRSLETERDKLKTRTIWAGSSQYNNPLFVECRKDVYILYPEKEAVAVRELEERNIFEKKAAGHDIIVLFVRPEGFESFNKAYAKVKAMSIALSYEPIEADQNLDFLKE